MKRSSSHSKRPLKSSKTFANEYDGSVISADTIVSSVDHLAGFYDKYVKTRTPVKIVLASNHPVDLDMFKIENIVDTLGYPEDKKLQVERKSAFGFGSGKSRELMSFSQIVEKLKHGDDSYYLTTQYDEHDVLDPEDGKDVSDMLEELNGTNPSEDDKIEDDGSVEEETDDEEYKVEAADDEGLGEDNNTEIPQGFGDFSDTSSIASFDVNDLHDDFDSINDQNYVDEDLKLTSGEATERLKSLYQAPLTELFRSQSLPITPKPFETLIPQQINLWMGLSHETAPKPALLQPTIESLGKWVPTGNSSGLHHDHADNLYVLAEGCKRFTLFCPKDAHKLFTVGDIDTVYANGLIDYKINKNARYWRKMRQDGSLVAEHAAWLLERKDYSIHKKEELERMVEEEEEYDGEIDASLDPPSFSTVPPVLLHLDELSDPLEIASLTKFANEKFPGFLELQKTEVLLEAGDMLYLPCGWFHEVTSYTSEALQAHIAINWWFMPPDGKSEAAPYKDNYWKEDFKKTKASIEFMKLC